MMGIAVLAWLFVTVVIVIARIIAKPVAYILAALIMLPWGIFYLSYCIISGFKSGYRRHQDHLKGV